MVLAMTSNTVLNRKDILFNCQSLSPDVREDIFVFASFQGECFQLLLIQYDVGCGFVIDGSHYLKRCSWLGTVAHACNPSTLGG